jgi:hypothetical protein
MRRPQEAVKRRRLAFGLSLGAALLFGWLLGSAGDGSGEPPSIPGRPGTRLELRSGVPVGFPHSSEGAAAAVAAYQQAFASPSILDPGALKARIEAVATPAYVRRMLSANGEGVARLAAGPIGTGLRAGVQTIYSAVPIGFAVKTYDGDRARILTWGFTLAGNAESVEPAAYFGASTTDVVWSADGWRIAATRSGFGPTPRLATRQGTGEGFEVLRMARQLRGYELVP